DSRHGIKKNDDDVLDLLDKAAVSYQIVLTKTDKIKAAGVPKLLAETAEKIRRRPAAYPGVLSTSSEKGDGLDELRQAIAETVGIARWK
ncbi:YihA family ribosome biogenesis GTP-binding protein, partial [Rhizobium ruizarguesonis]